MSGLRLIIFIHKASEQMSGRIQETLLSFLINYSKTRVVKYRGHRIKTQPESVLICNMKLNILEWSVPSQSTHSCQKTMQLDLLVVRRFWSAIGMVPLVSQGFLIGFTGVLAPQLLGYGATRQHLLYRLSQISLPLYSSPFIVTYDMQYYFQLYLACM